MPDAERSYYDILFKDNVSSIRKSWEILKGIIIRGKTPRMNPNKCVVNDAELRDTMVISNSSDDYFVNIGLKWSASVPPSNRNYESYMPKDNASSLFLAPSCSDEIFQIIKGLQNKSPGCGDIHAKVVEETQSYICHPLTHIANLSFRQGTFPNELKLAKVTPIYKGNNCKAMVNYRPTSVLPVFSKIYERLIQTRLYSHQ